ncbi:type II secretion system protein J [Clostridium thailandense]|uniref:Prepilin-type N-terminal cleavage/methylation domain-containing protein n=1 Tax=Clostridium thailandense TaxID=2794346 RepID=A0A949TUV7_9CLOT|nr:prepilin-type N-terminal cleavage/methylation domain-containing protein [Clostridium thailandense]MBV7275757.1 prepilin-type N-terminal cleavage/methylation domain-containing protein [Clostridium thailandense]MCH5136782.1 prepilin-type N-terminal cleavage/methylation domain-containing protein [Clostridiaceae bacterium UIB06]
MKKKGFTLVELMIALATFAILSLYLYQTFFSQIKLNFSFNDNIDLQYNINKALNILTDEIRNYSFTDISINGDQISSGGKVIVNLNSGGLNNDVDYDRANKILNLNDANGVNISKCTNIDSINMASEGEIIVITVSASQGKLKITSSTAVNVKR